MFAISVMETIHYRQMFIYGWILWQVSFPFSYSFLINWIAWWQYRVDMDGLFYYLKPCTWSCLPWDVICFWTFLLWLGRRKEVLAVSMIGKDGNGSGSDRVEFPCIRNRNPNPNRKSIRVEIHHQNQTRGYLKPE
jgi:hypothetical protein